MAERARPSGLIGASSGRASVTYRLVVAVIRTIGRGIFGFRTDVRGRPNLPLAGDGRPGGGWIAAGLPHRTWVDPFLVIEALPVEPRLVFFGDGPAIFRSAWRRWLVRRVGGVIPIWPDGERTAVEGYIAAATSALEAGAVLCIFPETGAATPPGTARPLGSGLAYFAIRSGAPIVPIVLGGTEDLYRGRRFRLEILPPVTWRDLDDAAADERPPAPWSSAERRVARRVTLRLQDLTAGGVETAHLASIPPPGTRRRWRWLTTAWH